MRFRSGLCCLMHSAHVRTECVGLQVQIRSLKDGSYID